MIFDTPKLNSLLKVLVIPFTLSFSPFLYAGEKEDAIIDFSVKAYGGEKLLNLKNLKYTDTIKHFFSHQSGHALVGATSQHLNQIQLEVTLFSSSSNLISF